MKRTRLGARERLSREAAELQRLSTGLSESGGKLEDGYWENGLAEAVDSLLKNGGEDDLNAALDRLFDNNARAHDELADMIEARAESCRVEVAGQAFDILLFAAPLLAWSRFSIASGSLPEKLLQALAVQLGAHVFAGNARIALANYLFSPDQLPRSYCDTRQLTEELGKAALASQHLGIDSSSMAETNRFLSDARYLIGAIALPAGSPLFRWNESDGNKDAALKEWQRQGGANLESLLTGCAWQLQLPNAYHAACRDADRESRPYSLQASVAFLQTTLNLEPDQLRAVIGPCHDRRLEEYRVGLGPLNGEEVFHGIVWPLLGNDDENSDTVGEIETRLRDAGLKEVLFLDHRFPMEFCDDCGAPMFPNAEGELVHAQMPEEASNHATPTLLH